MFYDYEYIDDENLSRRFLLTFFMFVGVFIIFYLISNWFWLKWFLLGIVVLSILVCLFFCYIALRSKYGPGNINESNIGNISFTDSVASIRLIDNSVVSSILNFEPSYTWPNETGYHAELHKHLKMNNHNSLVEFQTGCSRPDLVVDDLAIEVKGSTTDRDIASLPSKCVRYSTHYNMLVFVLFDPQWKKSKHTYEVFKGILDNFDNVVILVKVLGNDYVVYDCPGSLY